MLKINSHIRRIKNVVCYVSKVLISLFNILIFLAGLTIDNAFYTAFALFLSLIGVQLHFSTFENTSDTNKLNRFDMYFSICSLFILLVVFILRSATH